MLLSNCERQKMKTKTTSPARMYSCISETSTARKYLVVNLKESRCCVWPLVRPWVMVMLSETFEDVQVACRELMLEVEEEEEEILCSFHVVHCE